MKLNSETMKKITFLALLFVSLNKINAQISIELGAKGSYNSTWLFNTNISDKGADQDYAMAWGQNYGISAGAFIGPIGLAIEYYNGNHTGGYAGTISVFGDYKSNVKLKTNHIPLLLKFKGESGGYIELGGQLNTISRATHSINYVDSDIFDGESDVTPEYAKSYMSAILGFGANVRPMKSVPLALLVGIRLQYGFGDTKGVDAFGTALDNSIFYPTYQKTNAVSGGLMFGLTYTLSTAKN